MAPGLPPDSRSSADMPRPRFPAGPRAARRPPPGHADGRTARRGAGTPGPDRAGTLGREESGPDRKGRDSARQTRRNPRIGCVSVGPNGWNFSLNFSDSSSRQGWQGRAARAQRSWTAMPAQFRVRRAEAPNRVGRDMPPLVGPITAPAGVRCCLAVAALKVTQLQGARAHSTADRLPGLFFTRSLEEGKNSIYS
jgi:hypothetical protein